MRTQSILLPMWLVVVLIAKFTEGINTFQYHALADCSGVLCTPEQYCDTENDSRPVCKSKLNLGDACTGLGQCKPSNSDCLEDQCQCNSAFVRHQDGCIPSCADKECQAGFFCHATLTGCLPKVNLNSDCDETGGDQQCKSENAECLKEGDTSKCTCASDFVEKNGMCIPKCKDTVPESCSPIEFCESSSGLCQPKKPLHADCADTKECITPNSACEGNKCECEPDDFVDIYGACLPDCVKNSTVCDPATQYCSSTDRICNRKANLHERCSDPTESCLTENAVCTPETNTCECDTGFSDTGSACVTMCTDDASCTGEGELFCNMDNGQCETKRPLGQQCSATIKCSTDLRCLNQICSCQDDSVETVVDGTRVCIKKCEDNSNCDAENYYFCSSTLGLCTPQLGLNGGCNVEDVNEEKEISPCKDPSASCRYPSDTDTQALCLCNSDFVQDGVSCVAKCRNNADCQSNQTFCHPPTGLCEQKVPSLEKECLAEGTEQCLIANSECKDSGAGNFTCQCVSGHKQRNGACDLICQNSNQCSTDEYCDRDSSEFCMKKVQLNQPCSYEDQCSNANAACLEGEGEKKCQCVENYVNFLGSCKPDCRAAINNCNENQFCNDGTGQCQPKVGLNSKCNSDEECLNSEDSTICSPTTKTCRCKEEDYYEESKQCFLKCTKTSGCDFVEQYCNVVTSKCDRRVDLNGSCTVEGEEQCTALATCEPISDILKRCHCLPEAIASLDAKKCLKIANVIGDSCKEPQQCTANIVDSICNTESEECGCNTDSTGSANGKKCLKLASAIGDPCEEPQQCSVPALIGNNGITNTTKCSGTCDCADSAIKSEGKCYLNKALGDVCVEDVECSVSISGGKCDTTSNKCVCNEGTEGAVGSKQCSKPSDNAGVSPVNAKFHPVWAILVLITSFCFLP